MTRRSEAILSLLVFLSLLAYVIFSGSAWPGARAP